MRAVPTIEQVDLRRGEGDRLRAFIDRIEALPPGSPFEVLDRASLGRVYHALDAAFGSRFDWWVLEDGPHVFRALVARRSDQAGPVTLAGLFGADHGRMRTLFEVARKALAGGDRQAAAAAVAELRVGLTRHAAGEEELLFPIYVKSGVAGGQATVNTLIRDHEIIQDLLSDVIDQLGCEERFDEPQALKLLESLQKRVQAHEDHEERLVLPLCAHLVRPEEEKGRIDGARVPTVER